VAKDFPALNLEAGWSIPGEPSDVYIKPFPFSWRQARGHDSYLVSTHLGDFVKMRVSIFLTAAVLAPAIALAAPFYDEGLYTRDNLCSLKSPPALCQPNSSVTVEETAQRAYKFYRAFVVDGDPKTMFSLIDSTYKVNCPSLLHGIN
jgi:hypothetical protein